MTGHPNIQEQAADLFLETYALAPEERTRFLQQACADNQELLAATEELLGHHDSSAPVLRAVEELRDRPTQASGVPDTIGPYRVAGVLGRGGMGIVYRAEQQNPQRTVALKVLQPNTVPEFGERFRRETQILAQLQHPGIAQVFDAGTFESDFGEMPYFTMELVDGVPIDEFCKDRQLDVRTRCELIMRLSDAVQHAHDRGITHRDLKPGNILVTELRDGEWQPKILDFGIARAEDSFDSIVKTRTGELLGTLPYMSAEQVSNASVDHRTDVYSLGVIAYELFAGQLPFDLGGLSVPEMARQISEHEPMPLGRLDSRYRGDLETITGKALAKSPDHRYQTAEELGEDLRRSLRDEPIHARPPSTMYRLRKLARRRRGLVAGFTATALALMAGLIYGSLGPPETNDSREGATPITAVGRFAFTLEGATLDLSDSSLFNNGTPPANVWFRWTADTDGTFRVSPVGRASNADTFISIHDGAAVIGLSHRTGWQHDVGPAAVFVATAGQEYWISIFGPVNLKGEAELVATTVNPVVEATATFRKKTYVKIARCNWPTAAVMAHALGGHLVSIGDEDELAFVGSLLQDRAPVWIGGNDAAKEGTFAWTDGTPFDLPSELAVWAPGQPDDKGLGEDYLCLDPSARMSDAMGSAWWGAIVELPAGAVAPLADALRAAEPRRIGYWTVVPQGVPPQLAKVGDFDGDGHDDFAAGFPLGDWNGARAGWVSLRSGRTKNEILGGLPGRPGDLVGSALVGGDFNQDGQSDVIFAAPGWSNGRGRLLILDGVTKEASQFVKGVTGAPLAAGDFDGDDRPDVVAQATRLSIQAFSGDRSRLWRRDMAAPITALDVLGDVDGDGADDVVVGMDGYEAGNGRVECLSGRGGETLWLRNGHNKERLGCAVATIGDVDGDRVRDFAMGLRNKKSSRGAVVLVSGRAGVPAVMVTIEGRNGEHLGHGVAAAGDADGDGLPDFACWGEPESGIATVYVRSGTGALPVIRTYRGKTGSLTFLSFDRKDQSRPYHVLGDKDNTSVTLFDGGK